MILRWIVLCSTVHMVSPSPSSHTMRASSRYKDVSGREYFHQTGIIPLEQQVSLFLNKNETRRLTLKSERAGIPISIALTPCSSSIKWTVYFLPKDMPHFSDLKDIHKLQQFTSDELQTFVTSSAKQGQYIVMVKSLDHTYIQVFASIERRPPHQTRMEQKPQLKFHEKSKKNRWKVKWEQSLIDPQAMEYCLVVNTKKNYTSLCSAKGERRGSRAGEERLPSHKDRRNRLGPDYINLSRMGKNEMTGEKEDILITCIGRKTHHTIDNLEQGKVYYFNVFAVNRDNNLTFPFASTVIKFNQTHKQSKLKDGKPETFNLKKLDGKAVFKIKINKLVNDAMVVFVMPCGGAVNVTITTMKGKAVVRDKRVDSYGKINIPHVYSGQRFVITIRTPNRDELRSTDSVTVLASTKHNNPLPELPTQSEVKLIKRDCDTATVGWFPALDPSSVRYCVVAREIRKREAEFSPPDQCAIAKRLSKNTDYHVMQCQDWITPSDSGAVITQTIPNLKPNRRYIIQVTVKKNGGMTLSYNLLTVHTAGHPSQCIQSAHDPLDQN